MDQLYETIVKSISDKLISYICKKYTTKIKDCQIFMYQSDLYETTISGDYLRSHNAILLNYKFIHNSPKRICGTLINLFSQAVVHKLGMESPSKKNTVEYNKLLLSVRSDLINSLGVTSAEVIP